MQEFVIDSGIKEVAVKNEKGDLLTVLRFNVADGRTAEKFAQLTQQLNGIIKEREAKDKELDKKYAGRKMVYNNGRDVDTEQIIDRSKANIACIEKCIEEINSVFGQDTVKNVYRENYEMNAEFVPDMTALVELVDKLVPVMDSLFGQRFQTVKQKYNARNKGRYNKKNMIQGYK